MQTRGTFPALYTPDLPRSTSMTTASTQTAPGKKNGDTTKDDKDERESLAELASRLGLRDAEGKLDLEAAKRVLDSEVEAKIAREKAEAEAKKAAEAPPESTAKK
jgi:hypothetical protein